MSIKDRQYEEESVKRGLADAIELLYKASPKMLEECKVEAEGALVGKRKSEEKKEIKAAHVLAREEEEVSQFIEELYKDGKSPMEYFGTSWEQMEELEGKLEQYKAMQELQHISQEWDMYVNNAVVMKNIK